MKVRDYLCATKKFTHTYMPWGTVRSVRRRRDEQQATRGAGWRGGSVGGGARQVAAGGGAEQQAAADTRGGQVEQHAAAAAGHNSFFLTVSPPVLELAVVTASITVELNPIPTKTGGDGDAGVLTFFPYYYIITK